MKNKKAVFPAQAGILGKAAQTTANKNILKQSLGQTLRFLGTVLFIGWITCNVLLYAVGSFALILGGHL